MKYEDYEELTKDLTADNAVDIVRSMLEKLKSDVIETEAATATYEEKLSDMNDKYKSLQVDYIQKFTSQAGGVEEEEEEEDETEAVEKEIEEMLKEAQKGKVRNYGINKFTVMESRKKQISKVCI